MSIPKIFVSSTYDDLKHVREEISNFILNFGYTPVVFEKYDVPYRFDQSVEEACYDEIATCSMLVLVLKQRFGTKSNSNVEGFKANDKSSITQNEYRAAKKVGIPIFVFIENDSISEYKFFVNQSKNKKFKFTYLDGYTHALFIDEIHNDKNIKFIYSFSDLSEIKQALKKQWAGLFERYLTDAKKYSNQKNEEKLINPFKLFYFRRNLGISITKLSQLSRVSEKKLRKYENAGKLNKRRIDIDDFEKTSLAELQRIADVLKCSVGNIKGGLPDDFLSQFLLYYYKYRGTSNKSVIKNGTPSLFKCKIVLFDFDGTLTTTSDDLTTWEKMWLYLKYDINDCAELHKKFSTGEITHQEWCEITLQYFKEKKLSQAHINEIADEIKLIEGTKEVIEKLHKAGIKIYIVSGSIKYIIKRVLGDLYSYFEDVRANEFLFDNGGVIKSIVGTKYDFEGKANYIGQTVNENQIQPIEAFFIGNSLNDTWAHQSGAQTLCVNPKLTNPDHPFEWTYSIRSMKNLNEIFRYLLIN